MKQRLVLAKTLLPDPEVFLLDEPVRSLDRLERMELWRLLLELRNAGKAVLISSRSLTEFSCFCNKAAILEHGTLVFFGTISELGQPANGRRMSVKWRGHEPKAMEVLEHADSVNILTAAEQGAMFDFDGDSDALHELLRVLIAGEVHVTEWRGVEDESERVLTGSGPRPPD
jgi:ABC-2 type transport system ATP-binding protein